jgi:A/G-specific adenine glycosylase
MNFGGIIRGWYEKNKRDLPWRHTSDPYRIWLSEVILQQTRVAQGLGYYNRFIDTFPDVASLAAAPGDEVLKLWQGLGYYSRARNLHEAARDIVMNREGKFPSTCQELLKLKGVGEYTAAAIASLCYGEPVAAVDGNVARVIARIFGVEEPVNTQAGSRIIATLAQELLEEDFPPGEGSTGAQTPQKNSPDTGPGLHNQAMIDFGALICVPSHPDCPACPLNDHCQAWLTGKVDSLPVKKPKKKPVERWMYFYIVTDGSRVILSRRGNGDIWKSLYQFPVLETDSPLSAGEIPARLQPVLQDGRSPADQSVREPAALYGILPGSRILHISAPVKHLLSHRTLHASFIHVRVDRLPELPPGPVAPPGNFAVPLGELHKYPVPRLIDRYLEDHLAGLSVMVGKDPVE